MITVEYPTPPKTIKAHQLVKGQFVRVESDDRGIYLITADARLCNILTGDLFTIDKGWRFIELNLHVRVADVI